MIHNSFYNWIPAQTELQNASDHVISGALRRIHFGIIECAGVAPIGVVSERRLPAYPLDLLWFYQSVASIVHDWGLTSSCAEIALTSEMYLATDDEENSLALKKFSTTLSEVPRSEPVDEVFCCWLFAEVIVNPGLLGSVLDGSIGRDAKSMESEDFDTWASRWI